MNDLTVDNKIVIYVLGVLGELINSNKVIGPNVLHPNSLIIFEQLKTENFVVSLADFCSVIVGLYDSYDLSSMVKEYMKCQH